MADKSRMRFFAAVLCALLMNGCSGAASEDEQYVADELGLSNEEASTLLDEYSSPEDAVDDYRDANGYSYGGSGYEDRQEFDEDEAREEAERELANSGYDYSYGCTDDCSGHEAGWQWRADNGYSTYGKSQSFAEGGYAFDEAVDERVDEMRDEYEAGEEPY